jgi:hypothetical protein
MATETESPFGLWVVAIWCPITSPPAIYCHDSEESAEKSAQEHADNFTVAGLEHRIQWGPVTAPVTSTATPPLHVYDWLAQPSNTDGERDAKEWLDKFCRPVLEKHEQGIDAWLAKYRLTVEWQGQRYTCTGASRLGDVWLKEDGSTSYYDHRVEVEELSNWERVTLTPHKNGD